MTPRKMFNKWTKTREILGIEYVTPIIDKKASVWKCKYGYYWVDNLTHEVSSVFYINERLCIDDYEGQCYIEAIMSDEI